MSTSAQPRRTLWEEGRHPGQVVAFASAAGLLVVVLLNLLAFGRLTLFFDVCFVALCVAAALTVRPRDFFVVGVLPPLLLAVSMLSLAILDRGVVADRDDVLLQALVSGLAHHAGALIVGYGLTLALLALRQVAFRHAGALRAGVRSPGETFVGPQAGPEAEPETAPVDDVAPRIPQQRRPDAHLRS